MRAIARHGLAKLGMSDVSQSAGVSRGTLYRYFPTREDLMTGVVREEVRRFRERVQGALTEPGSNEQRIQVVLEQAAQHIREHGPLQRILETDPAFLLTSLRAQFPTIRAGLHELLAPLLRETEAVRAGIVHEDQLVDWTTRMLISVLLFQDPDPDGMARGLTAMYRLLTTP
ncbi:MAG: TetR/AcrR family transcriptional regulator [Deltaproteobacteria bacterium]|nr:MAG: TetR/AcrR family transcriptional regulator [Deltaproteobacteria bacterium]